MIFSWRGVLTCSYRHIYAMRMRINHELGQGVEAVKKERVPATCSL